MFISFCCLSSYANTIKYYQNYSIDEWDYSVVGKDSLSIEQARQAICNKFTYDSTGRLIKIIGVADSLNYLDSFEKVYQIVFEYQDDVIYKYYYSRNGHPMKSKRNGVFGEKIEKFPGGYRVYFLNDKKEPIENNSRVYAIVVEIDRKKRVAVKSFYDKNNLPMKNSLDVYKIQLKFNNRQLAVEKRCLNKNNQLLMNNLNFAIKKISYNKEKERIKESFFDTQGRLTAIFPVGIAVRTRQGGDWQNYNANLEPIKVINSKRIDAESRDSINYHLVVNLTTANLLENFVSVEQQLAFIFYAQLPFDKHTGDSLMTQYYQRWYGELDSLKKAGVIFRQGYAFLDFHSDVYENPLLAKELIKTPVDSLTIKLQKLLFIQDTTAINVMNQYSDLATRFCYGWLKVPDIVFFRWNDILFCVNPYYESHGGSSEKLARKITVDFRRIPISKDIRHIFFEGVAIDYFSPRINNADISYYFNYCLLNPQKDTKVFKNLVRPGEVANNEVILYSNSNFIFTNCQIDSVQLILYSGNSSYPVRFYPGYRFHFNRCRIDYIKIYSDRYVKPNLSRHDVHDLEFYNSNIGQLEMTGLATSLIFNNARVRNFYAANVDTIEKQIQFINSSFESPLNFLNLILKKDARFEMINTSYQGYMKFPWQEIKGKIELSTNNDVLKTYGNLYNLLKSNYNMLSLIKDADDCYYYWKQFERKNFWRLYWKEPNRHWYNPFDLAKAVGLMIFNHVNYFSCGYGVKPLWIFPFTLFIVSFFALIYFFLPTRISNLEEHLMSRDKIAEKLRKMKVPEIKDIFQPDDFNFKQKKQGLIEDIVTSMGTEELLERLSLKPKSRYRLEFFWYCFYFSFSTFTTIGIGDWYPAGKLNKALVMVEGALGWLCLGLFITTYANILLR